MCPQNPSQSRDLQAWNGKFHPLPAEPCGFAQIDVVIIPFALALGDKIDAQKRCVGLRGEGRGQHLPAVCRACERIAELCILVIFLPGGVALTECEICFCGFCGTIRSLDLDGDRIFCIRFDWNCIICGNKALIGICTGAVQI